MPQQKKDNVRQAMLEAARRRLAAGGIDGARLSLIAADAKTSIGNLYKYFSGKDELFAAAIPAQLALDLRARLRQQVEALGAERDVHRLPANHPYRRAREGTREFTQRHRHELIFLLRHAQGTCFDGFADEVAADLVVLAIEYAKRAYPCLELTLRGRRALQRMYRAYVTTLADILAEEDSPIALEQAIQSHATYHLAGLAAFFAEEDASTIRGQP